MHKSGTYYICFNKQFNQFWISHLNFTEFSLAPELWKKAEQIYMKAEQRTSQRPDTGENWQSGYLQKSFSKKIQMHFLLYAYNWQLV